MIKIAFSILLAFSLSTADAGSKRKKKTTATSNSVLLSSLGSNSNSCTWTPPRRSPNENPMSYSLTLQQTGIDGNDNPMYESCADAKRRKQTEWMNQNFPKKPYPVLSDQLNPKPYPLFSKEKLKWDPPVGEIAPTVVTKDGIKYGKWQSVSQSPHNCQVHNGEITCKSCSTTTEPFVSSIPCKQDSDCVFVKSNCCTGKCRPHAIHKSQLAEYNSQLKRTCFEAGYFAFGATSKTTGIPTMGCACATNPGVKYTARCTTPPQGIGTFCITTGGGGVAGSGTIGGSGSGTVR